MESDHTPNDTPDDDTEAVAPDPLAEEIAAAADRVEIGDQRDMLATVRTTATRHRRRRSALAGLAAAGVLVASSVAIANFAGGGSGNDRIASAPGSDVPTTDPADTDPADTMPTVTDPLTTDTPAAEVADETVGAGPVATEVAAVPSGAAPANLVPSEASLISDPALSEAARTGQHELFAWKGGFLSIRTSYEAQPLPTELPEDVVEAFPPEVVDLFPDGLPPTIEEATQILQEAGMLDVVTEILSDNRAVSDAIYSASPAAPVRSVRFSPDGIEWQDIDSSFPDVPESWNEATSTGDRFVFATTITGPIAPTDDAAAEATPPIPETIEIYSSTDLIDWSVQSIPVPDRPVDVDPAFPFYAYSHGLAATDDGFVISVDTSVEFDVVGLLDPELQERIDTGGGMSLSEGDAGVTIGLYEQGSDGREPTETLTFTWEELGIDNPPSADSANTQRRYAGAWDGTPVESSDVTGRWSDVVAVGDVFVELHGSPRQSDNGIDWTPLDLPDEGFVDAVVDTSDGVVVHTTGGRGTETFYVGDLATGDWTPVDVPDLPDGLQTESSATGAFLFADYGEDAFDDPYADSIGSRERAEVDGYRYELESTSSGNEFSATYRLTEIATGTVVVAETSDGGTDGEPFEYLEYQSDFGDGFRIIDPESGEAIVSISYDDVTRQIVTADGAVVDAADIDVPEITDGPMDPQFWLLAFVDDGWMLQQVSDGDNSDEYATSVAASGDVALIAWSDGTITSVTPS